MVAPGSDRAAAGPGAAHDHARDEDDDDAPMTAVTIDEMSSGPSIGLVLNSAPARKPPTSAPTMPSTMCPMTPSPSSPLTRKPARYPAMAPSTIHAMMLMVETSVPVMASNGSFE